jgi:hypothetical protein
MKTVNRLDAKAMPSKSFACPAQLGVRSKLARAAGGNLKQVETIRTDRPAWV